MKNKPRWLISITFLILIPFIGILHNVKGGEPNGYPSVDALCPFGGLETLPIFIKSGSYIDKVTPSSFILLIAVIILSIFLGKAFCGYVCPLGTLQSLINKLAKKLNISQIKMPNGLDKILRFAKYLILFTVLFITYTAGKLIIKPYDPWTAFMHLSFGSELFEKFLIGFIILILILVISLFVERAWCKYFCPLGAALSITSVFRIFKIQRNSSTCINCKACTHNCPMGLNVHSSCSSSGEFSGTVPSTECISCGECVVNCPIENTLNMKKGTISLSLNKTASLIIIILFLVTGINIYFNNFKTFSPKREFPTQSRKINSNNIKGYMTINEICKEFNVEPNIILKNCNLPEDTDLDIPIKDLKSKLASQGIEFHPSTLREVISKLKP